MALDVIGKTVISQRGTPIKDPEINVELKKNANLRKKYEFAIKKHNFVESKVVLQMITFKEAMHADQRINKLIKNDGLNSKTICSLKRRIKRDNIEDFTLLMMIMLHCIIQTK